MRVRCHYNSWVAKVLRVQATTLYPFIFFAANREEALRRKIVEHEFVHVRQVRRLGWLRFYVSYVWEFCLHWMRTRSYIKAWLATSYEIEAYEAELKVILSESELRESQ